MKNAVVPESAASQPSEARSLMKPSSPKEHERALKLQSFAFRHSLGNAPLLSLPAIREITKKLLDQRRFDQILFYNFADGAEPRKADADNGGRLLDTLDHYDSRRAWLRLSRVDEIAPEFNDIVEQFYQDLSILYKKDIKRDVIKTFPTLFISSPGSVTPYHIDHTWNCLLQISGKKTVHLFDQNDPQVLTQVDKENWYGPRIPVSQKKDIAGIPYPLEAGDGVHHPVNAPHWVQNGSDVSISLSIGLCLRESTRDAHVYQANHLLRRLRLHPVPPRTSAWRDSLKCGFMGALSDRSPQAFDDVLFSGMNRLRRIVSVFGLSVKPGKKIEVA